MEIGMHNSPIFRNPGRKNLNCVPKSPPLSQRLYVQNSFFRPSKRLIPGPQNEKTEQLASVQINGKNAKHNMKICRYVLKILVKTHAYEDMLSNMRVN